MKKKILALILGVILCLSLTACSGDNYSSVPVTGVQDTSYAVVGNGGNAVQYGNYVYFVNGYRGSYTDTDGNANVWGNVVKGAIYRAELKGTKSAGTPYSTFTVERDTATGLDFVSEKAIDLDMNQVDRIGVQTIAPKTIGTSGYSGGGIFIFDNYVYYASPNNQKDKGGTVQADKTDFFRTSLDGKKTQKLFTTSSATADKPYGFYKYRGNMYVVVLDGTSLKSIKVGDRKCEVTEIASNVDNAVFPVKDVYYNGISENGVEDFVYVTYTAGANDSWRAGNILEAIRPDGSERGVFQADGTTASIDAVRDGLVFYRSVTSGINTTLHFSNLHDFFMGENEDGKTMFPSYVAAQDALADGEKTENVKGVALTQATETVNGYAAIYPMRPNRNSNMVYVVVSTSSGIDVYYNNNAMQVYAGSNTFQTVDGNYVYFTEGDSNTVYRTNVFTAAATKPEEEKREKLTDATTLNTSGIDICAGYLVYFANLDDNYTNYTHFYELDGYVGREPIFVGKITSSDAPSADAGSDEDSGDENA